MTEDPAHALEQAHAVRQGHSGVVTKLVREAEDVLRSESLITDQHSRLKVIR